MRNRTFWLQADSKDSLAWKWTEGDVKVSGLQPTWCRTPHVSAVCYTLSISLSHTGSMRHRHCHVHDNRNTFTCACIGLITHTHISLCTPETHPHRACWDLPVTNNHGVKCVSVTSVCCQHVRLQWMRNRDVAPTSRGSPGGLCQSRLSPNYRLRLPAAPSSQRLSQALLSHSSHHRLWKMSCRAESES